MHRLWDTDKLYTIFYTIYILQAAAIKNAQTPKPWFLRNAWQFCLPNCVYLPSAHLPINVLFYIELTWPVSKWQKNNWKNEFCNWTNVDFCVCRSLRTGMFKGMITCMCWSSMWHYTRTIYNRNWWRIDINLGNCFRCYSRMDDTPANAAKLA
jgi:hypothetical protein